MTDYNVRDDLPAGLTSDTPMSYGYKRWNGAVWCTAWVDHYNRLLARAVQRHRWGYDATPYVDALYRQAALLDQLSKEEVLR